MVTTARLSVFLYPLCPALNIIQGIIARESSPNLCLTPYKHDVSDTLWTSRRDGRKDIEKALESEGFRSL